MPVNIENNKILTKNNKLTIFTKGFVDFKEMIKPTRGRMIYVIFE